MMKDERGTGEEGPIKPIDPDKVPKEPLPMMTGFEWVTMDLTSEEEVRLLSQTYGNLNRC